MAGSWGSKRTLPGFENSASFLLRIPWPLWPPLQKRQLDPREVEAGGKLRSRRQRLGKWPHSQAWSPKGTNGVREMMDGQPTSAEGKATHGNGGPRWDGTAAALYCLSSRIPWGASLFLPGQDGALKVKLRFKPVLGK